MDYLYIVNPILFTCIIGYLAKAAIDKLEFEIEYLRSRLKDVEKQLNIEYED